MKQFKISEKDKGRKLFRFVKTILPGLKNNDIFKLIRKKIVAVNNNKPDPNYILKTNDLIKIFLSEEHFNKKGKKNKFVSVKKDINIIFENNDILVINKPYGILVHPNNKEYKNTIYEYVRSYLYSKKEYDPTDTFTPTPCHRLDRNTSGLLIIAKKHETLKNISLQFKNREVDKTYITIVYGNINKEILITSKIETEKQVVKVYNLQIKNDIPIKEKFLKNNPLLSVCHIKPIKNSNNLSLLEINLWTGKKHQIRAQLSANKTPLLGDKKYFTKGSKEASKKLNFNSYYLHSYKLKIIGYNEWKTEIPEIFKRKIDLLF